MVTEAGRTNDEPTEFKIEEAIARLSSPRQHRRADGERSPHKRLLILLALGRLARTGSSAITWAEAEQELGALIREFGRPSSTTAPQSAAYPFTRLRADGLWDLDAEVPADNLRPLREMNPTGRFRRDVEVAIIGRGDLGGLARRLAEDEFAPSVVPDLLLAVGFDPETPSASSALPARRRSSDWPRAVIEAWDRQCAFCGFDGQLGGYPVGLEAAHIRWFTHDGPDDLDNGLALCALHHKLLDRGALGLDGDGRILVSSHFSARTDTARHLYELHGRELRPRPGTPAPAEPHVAWHCREVFRGPAISA